jgi:hypothetical protein
MSIVPARTLAKVTVAVALSSRCRTCASLCQSFRWMSVSLFPACGQSILASVRQHVLCDTKTYPSMVLLRPPPAVGGPGRAGSKDVLSHSNHDLGSEALYLKRFPHVLAEGHCSR